MPPPCPPGIGAPFFSSGISETSASVTGGPLKPGFCLSGDVQTSRTTTQLTKLIVLMAWGLTRFHRSGQSHFVTFCCYHRRRLLDTDESCRIFESALERVRRSYRLYVYGYVVMPEHVHLLLSEPNCPTQSKIGLEWATRPSNCPTQIGLEWATRRSSGTGISSCQCGFGDRSFVTVHQDIS